MIHRLRLRTSMLPADTGTSSQRTCARLHGDDGDMNHAGRTWKMETDMEIWKDEKQKIKKCGEPQVHVKHENEIRKTGDDAVCWANWGSGRSLLNLFGLSAVLYTHVPTCTLLNRQLMPESEHNAEMRRGEISSVELWRCGGVGMWGCGDVEVGDGGECGEGAWVDAENGAAFRLGSQ